MRLIVVAVAQVAISFMDLIAIVLTGVVVALALSATAGLPTPGVVSALVEGLGLEDWDEVSLAVAIAILAAALLVSKTLISAWLARRTFRLLVAPQVGLSARLLENLLNSGLLEVQRTSSQAVSYSLNSGVTAVVAGVIGSAMTLGTESALLLVVGVGLLAIDPVVALGAVVFFALIAVAIQRAIGAFIHRLGRLVASSSIDSQRLAQDALATYREVVVLNRQSLVVERFIGARTDNAYSQTMGQFLQQIPKYVFELGLVVGAVLLCGALFISRSPVAALSLLAVFLAAATRVTPSILRLQGALLTLRNSVGLAQPTLQLARRDSSNRPSLSTVTPRGDLHEGPAHSMDLDPRLELRDISFTYPGAPSPALTGISAVLEAGQSLALTGPSGAGKSTFADLILGLLQPDEGMIRLAGRPPKEVVEGWPGALAYVPQAVWLVEGTIQDNVALTLPSEHVQKDLVWEALDAAKLLDFVASKPDGLDTQVGERGVQLSGGQRQRLGIARALYSRPRLLVLDEATSALDAETEAAISETIQRLHGKVTTVVIAHRLATIREADVVMYLEEGRLIAQGSFSDVRRQAPRFDVQANLLGLQ